jgi:hypothetical protein
MLAADERCLAQPLPMPPPTAAASSQLSDQVKLVGPVISCEGTPYRGDASGPWRRNAHVQSYALATDAEGLQVLMMAWTLSLRPEQQQQQQQWLGASASCAATNLRPGG